MSKAEENERQRNEIFNRQQKQFFSTSVGRHFKHNGHRRGLNSIDFLNPLYKTGLACCSLPQSPAVHTASTRFVLKQPWLSNIEWQLKIGDKRKFTEIIKHRSTSAGGNASSASTLDGRPSWIWEGSVANMEHGTGTVTLRVGFLFVKSKGLRCWEAKRRSRAEACGLRSHAW